VKISDLPHVVVTKKKPFKGKTQKNAIETSIPADKNAFYI
jgi:hypothetical protein